MRIRHVYGCTIRLMRAWIAASAMTVGSIAFQFGLQAGWFNSVTWAAPWAWGLSAALWMIWLLSHPKVEKEWLNTFHKKVGRGIHAIRIAVGIAALLAVALTIRAWTQRVQAKNSAGSGNQQSTQVAQPSPPPSPQQPQSQAPAAKERSKASQQSTSIKVNGDNNTTSAVTQSGANNTAIVGNNNSVTIGPARSAGNLKERTIQLSNDIRAGMAHHGQMLMIGGMTEGPRYYHEMSGVFRWTYLGRVKDIFKEFATTQPNIKNDGLAQFLANEKLDEDLRASRTQRGREPAPERTIMPEEWEKISADLADMAQNLN